VNPSFFALNLKLSFVLASLHLFDIRYPQLGSPLHRKLHVNCSCTLKDLCFVDTSNTIFPPSTSILLSPVVASCILCADHVLSSTLGRSTLLHYIAHPARQGHTLYCCLKGSSPIRLRNCERLATRCVSISPFTDRRNWESSTTEAQHHCPRSILRNGVIASRVIAYIRAVFRLCSTPTSAVTSQYCLFHDLYCQFWPEQYCVAHYGSCRAELEQLERLCSQALQV